MPSPLMSSCRRGARALPLLFALVACLAPLARPQNATPAQDQLKQLSLEQLGNVEVTIASKQPEEVWQTPAAVFVLTSEDIRRSGATSVPEVLRLVPGVEVARVNSNSWAIGIRGFNSGFSKSVLVLIDGRSVYTPLFAGVYWDAQNVMLEDVERIEVIRGPGGTIWGANAVNGVINIITKNAKQTHGALVSVGGGNADQGTGDFRYGGSVGDNLDYRAYGMAFGRSAEFHVDGNDYDPWQFGQAGFRADWQPTARDAVTIQGDIYKASEGQYVTIATYQPPGASNVIGTQDVSGGNILGHWDHEFSDSSNIHIQAYYDRTYRFGPQFGETRNTFDFDFIHNLKLERNNIIWGFGIRLSPDNFIQTVPTVDFPPHHQLDSIYSGFVQDTISLVPDKFSITVGTKLEHNNFSGFDAQPSGRFLWTPTAHNSLWGAVTRAVRTPSRIDEDLQLTGYAESAGTPFFLTIQGDPHFKPEQMIGFELGYRTLVTPNFYFDISTYYNNYSNLTSYGDITFGTAPPPAPPYLLIIVPYANGIKAITRGVEIAPDYKISEWWHLRGSYSFLSLTTSNEPGFGDTGTASTYVGSSPRHQVKAQSLFNLTPRLEFDPTFRYVGALPAQGVNAYSEVDIHLGYHVTRHLELSLTGDNLLSPHHPEFASSPGPIVEIKRSLYGKLVWRSKED